MATTTTLHLRVDEESLERFRQSSQSLYHKDPNDLLRELIDAAGDGRVTIKPNEGQRKLYSDIDKGE